MTFEKHIANIHDKNESLRRYIKWSVGYICYLLTVKKHIISLVSNISRRSIRKVIEELINDNGKAKALEKCIHGRIHNAHGPKIRLSLEGIVSKHHRCHRRIFDGIM